MDKKYIINLQGKEYITYNGLISKAHEMGISSMKTDIVQFPLEENKNTCICKAVLCGKDSLNVFEGYGDAGPHNVNRMIVPHLIRMAETRAKARALRDFTNIGMTAFEELGGDVFEKDLNKEVVDNGKKASDSQMKFIKSLMLNNSLNDDGVKKICKESFGENIDMKNIGVNMASKIISVLRN